MTTLPTRRQFLADALAATAACALAPALAGDEAERPVIVDCHTHFYDPTRPEGIPWPGKDNKELYRKMLPEQFFAAAGGSGVTGTVVVEASPRVEDNQWLLDLAEKDPRVLGVVGNLTPGQEGFPEHLARFAKNPLYRGFRVSHGLIKSKLDDVVFREHVELLVPRELELDVNGGPDMPHDVAKLAKMYPELTIVINHVANVAIDGKTVPDDWRRGLHLAAEHPRVFCKVSALVEGAGRGDQKPPADPAYYHPILEAVWKIFGPDRLIYASNWPVSNRFADYPTLFRIVDAFFTAKGAEAKKKFFALNSQAAYRWRARAEG